ncbi:hypothetical protein [Alteromonas lipotrueae]|uniref:hypothetical protein n=1 Tax=Alteromonas lipotrueae TaxID=2803814 RepID=UPI0035A6EEC3
MFISAVYTLSSTFSYAQAQVADDTTSAETASVEEISVIGAATNISIAAEDIGQYQVNDLADIFGYSPSISVGGRVEASYLSNDDPRYSGSLYGKLSDTLGILNFP